MIVVPNVTLANGVEMPTLGLGTSPLSDADTEVMVRAALEAGYRLERAVPIDQFRWSPHLEIASIFRR